MLPLLVMAAAGIATAAVSAPDMPVNVAPQNSRNYSFVVGRNPTVGTGATTPPIASAAATTESITALMPTLAVAGAATFGLIFLVSILRKK